MSEAGSGRRRRKEERFARLEGRTKRALRALVAEARGNERPASRGPQKRRGHRILLYCATFVIRTRVPTHVVTSPGPPRRQRRPLSIPRSRSIARTFASMAAFHSVKIFILIFRSGPVSGNPLLPSPPPLLTPFHSSLYEWTSRASNLCPL